MKSFVLKFVLLAALMFISVLGGMQVANDGIGKMKGYEDPGFQRALSVEEKETGVVKMSVLGNEVGSHDLEAKKKQLEEIEAFNLFSSIGRKLSDAVATLSKSILEAITG